MTTSSIVIRPVCTPVAVGALYISSSAPAEAVGVSLKVA